MIVDIHSHLDHKLLIDNLSRIIDNAEAAGVKAIFTAGINPHTNRIALKLAERYGIVKPALGIYPIEPLKKELEADNINLPNEPFDIDKEIDFIRKQKPPLIGEVGMDRAVITDKDKEQEELFMKFIELSEKIKKPIIVHSRKAEQRCIELLESSSNKKIIMHCFMGKKKLMHRIRDNGWSFSIPPIIVRSQQFQMMAEDVPLSQIFTETDAPYLSPFKDTINEPAFITETIKKIAEIKEMEAEEVEKILFMNYQRMF